MKHILLLLSSPRGDRSYSNQVADRVVRELRARHPGAAVVTRDLAAAPLPHVGEAFVNALFVPVEQRSAEQSAAIAPSDAAVDELLAADTVVLAVPMYNFGLPSTLKAWIDHVARAGRTFAYTETGPRGLATGKKVILVLSRGGVYSAGAMKDLDFQESYLRSVLGFLGMTDVHAVRIEGVAMGELAVRNALDAAKVQADAVLEAVA